MRANLERLTYLIKSFIFPCEKEEKEEIAQLIEAGFEYICEHEGLKFFRKMK